MIRMPNRSDAKRLTTGVLVAGVVAAGAVALAGPASAATTDATKLSITPKSQNQLSYDGSGATCSIYTITETTAGGAAATTDLFKPVVTLSGGTKPAICQAVSPDNNTSSTYTVGVDDTNTSGSSSTTTIKAANPTGTISATATLVVADTENDLVGSLAVSPSSVTTYNGDDARLLVTATDSAGNAVDGAEVYYQYSDGGGSTSCGDTDSNGVVECDVPAETDSSTSTVILYVNNSAGGANTTYQSNAGEVHTQATVTSKAALATDDVTLTCTNQGANGNGDNHDCLVPAGTASVTFTATVENSDANGTEQPVSGAVVDFDLGSGPGTLSAFTAVTGTDGTATVTYTPSSTTSPESAEVTASSNGYNDTADVSFATKAADQVLLNPGSEDLTIGSAVSETATVEDQFGNPLSGESVTVSSGSRNVNSITKTTTSTGAVTLSYTDMGSGQGSDTITATDNTANLTKTATVRYLTSVSPTALALNFDGSTTSCPTDTTDPTTSVDVDGTEVCALVSNSGGNATGQSVTFTVSKGSVSNGSAAGTATSFPATTNSNGIAEAYVYSTTPGAQTITATAGTLSKTLTDTYTAGEAAGVTLTPVDSTIEPGNTEQFTATIVDQYGNTTVKNEENNGSDYVLFSQSGPGSLSTNTNDDDGYVYTTTGVANVILTVADNSPLGAGTVTAQEYYDNTPAKTVSYTVGTPVVAKSVSVSLSGAAKIGAAGTASATVTGTDGNPLAGETVDFAVTGATQSSGTGVTNSSGMATYNFTAQHAGTFTVTATATSATVSGTAMGSTAKTSIQTQLALTSTTTHQVRMSADTKPALANNAIYFYMVGPNGGYKQLGVKTSDSKGDAVFVVSGLKSGSTFRGVAKVNKVPSDDTGLYSNPKSVKVK